MPTKVIRIAMGGTVQRRGGGLKHQFFLYETVPHCSPIRDFLKPFEIFTVFVWSY